MLWFIFWLQNVQRPRGVATSWAPEPTSLQGVRGGQQQQRVKQRVWEQHVVCMFVCSLHTNMYFCMQAYNWEAGTQSSVSAFIQLYVFSLSVLLDAAGEKLV